MDELAPVGRMHHNAVQRDSQTKEIINDQNVASDRWRGNSAWLERALTFGSLPGRGSGAPVDITRAAGISARCPVYKNSRFGYSLTYPSEVFSGEPESANGDGRKFYSADHTAKVAVFGAYNTEKYTMEEYRDTLLKQFAGYEKVTYSPRGKTWFVLSGFHDGAVYYQKVMFSCEKRGHQCSGGQLAHGQPRALRSRSSSCWKRTSIPEQARIPNAAGNRDGSLARFADGFLRRNNHVEQARGLRQTSRNRASRRGKSGSPAASASSAFSPSGAWAGTNGPSRHSRKIWLRL